MVEDNMESNAAYVTNLVNSIIGVGVLAMPYCFKQCGIILGLGLLASAACLTMLSCNMLASSAFHKRRRTYEYLALYTLGPTGKFAVELSMIGLMLGTCVAFYVVIGDLATEILSKFVDNVEYGKLRQFVLIFCGLCVALPLGLMKDLSVLGYLGVFSLLFYLTFVCVVILNAVTNGLLEFMWWDDVVLWRPAGIFKVLPIFSLAYSCHCQLFVVYDSLENPSVRRIDSIVSSSIKFVSAIYMLVGFFGYTTFAGKVEGNLLRNLTSNVLLDCIKLGFAFSVVVGFPLMIFPCRQAIYTLFFSKVPVGDGLPAKTYIAPFAFKMLTFLIVTITMTVAILIPNVETILGLTGATMGSLICFIFPALIYEKAAPRGPGMRSKVIFLLGVILLVISTYSNLNVPTETTDIVPQQVKDIVDNIEKPKTVMLNIQAPNIPDQPALVPGDKDKPPDVEKPKAEVVDNDKRLEPANPVDPVIEEEMQSNNGKEEGGGEQENRLVKDGKASKEEELVKRNNEVEEKEQIDSPKKIENEGKMKLIPVNEEDLKTQQEKENTENGEIKSEDHRHEVPRQIIPKKSKDKEALGKQEIVKNVPLNNGEANKDMENKPKVIPTMETPEEEKKKLENEKELLEKIKIQHEKQQELLQEQEKLIKALEGHQEQENVEGENGDGNKIKAQVGNSKQNEVDLESKEKKHENMGGVFRDSNGNLRQVNLKDKNPPIDKKQNPNIVDNLQDADEKAVKPRDRQKKDIEKVMEQEFEEKPNIEGGKVKQNVDTVVKDVANVEKFLNNGAEIKDNVVNVDNPEIDGKGIKDKIDKLDLNKKPIVNQEEKKIIINDENDPNINEPHPRHIRSSEMDDDDDTVKMNKEPDNLEGLKNEKIQEDQKNEKLEEDAKVMEEVKETKPIFEENKNIKIEEDVNDIVKLSDVNCNQEDEECLKLLAEQKPNIRELKSMESLNIDTNKKSGET